MLRVLKLEPFSRYAAVGDVQGRVYLKPPKVVKIMAQNL